MEHYFFANHVFILRVDRLNSTSSFDLHSNISLGNIKPDENPTHYRSPRQYIDMCQSRIVSGTPEQPHEQVYELIFAKALESYYDIKQNNNQVKENERMYIDYSIV